MEIKTYQPDELQTVLGIFSSYPKIFPEWERALLKKELLELNQNHLAFTCQIKGEIVGFTSFKKFEDAENSWCVNWLAVNNNHSRKGVATLLLKYVFDLAKSMKLKQVLWKRAHAQISYQPEKHMNHWGLCNVVYCRTISRAGTPRRYIKKLLNKRCFPVGLHPRKKIFKGQ